MKLSERMTKWRNNARVDSRPPVDLWIDCAQEVEGYAAEAEQMVQYLAHECAKAHGGTMDEWMILAQDCIGSTYWRDTMKAIEQARAEAARSQTVQRVQQLNDRILERRGGQPLPDSTEFIRAGRAERTGL